MLIGLRILLQIRWIFVQFSQISLRLAAGTAWLVSVQVVIIKYAAIFTQFIDFVYAPGKPPVKQAYKNTIYDRSAR